MRKYLLLFVAGFLVCACGGNNNNKKGKNQPTFQPQSSVPSMEVTKGPGAQSAETAQGRIKMAALLPDNVDESIKELLETRINAIATRNHVGSNEGASTIVIIPKLVEVSRDITATAPPKHTVNYEFSVNVADLLTGDIYAGKQFSLVGVGDSDELASKNAVMSIKPSDDAYSAIIKEAEEKAFAYYEKNCDRLVADALAMAKRNEFDQAILVLNSIPEGVASYDSVVSARNKVLDSYFVSNANLLVSKMKAAMGAPKDNEEGYSEEFLALYAMVPANSPAKKEADALYAQYCKGIDAVVKQKMANKQKEWEANLAAQGEIRKNEMEIKKTEIIADAAKSGFQAIGEGLKNRKRGLLF